MQKKEHSFSYEVYESEAELSNEDSELMKAAHAAIKKSYSPYSQFRVAAAARLQNGEIVTGANQENAAFPAGLCAEGVVLATVSSLYPGIPIETLAVTYHNENGPSDRPISPCGICRQSLQEFEQRTHQPIRLILGGEQGKIFIIPHSNLLLPFAFSSDELK